MDENMKDKKVRIIAEAASNHGGDINLAKEFIRSAAQCGVDTVKFQSSHFKDLTNENDPQAEWVKKSSLSDEAHFILIDECKKNNVDFLTTCFSITRIPFLSTLGINEIKVASPDLMSFNMLLELSKHFDHLIISVGMHSLKEIKKAITFLKKNKINATLLHTTSQYPTDMGSANMLRFLWLKEKYPSVGFSNHISHVDPSCFAISNGASIIETHFKLADEGKGRAAPWDVSLTDLKRMCEFRNNFEKFMGDPAICLKDDYLTEQDIKARERFIGRWGNNK